MYRSAAVPKLSPAFSREYGLDWLRVIAFAILIFYHCGMMFVSWGWHIKNPETSRELELVMLFFNRWRLPLLFFISGAGIWFSLRRRSSGEFVRERTVRLLLPLAFGMLVVVPPQIYVERIEQGAAYASYFDFWRTVFEFEAYPKGNLSWHHLWFVAYVFVYALLGLPIFNALRSGAGRRVVSRFAGLLERYSLAAYAINFPNVVVSLTLGPRWPATHNLVADWANFTGSFLTLLWGFMIASDRRILDLITARRREFAFVWTGLLVVFYGVAITGTRRDLPPFTWELVNAYIGQMAIFTLVGYARHHLNFTNGFLSYATEAVYPFYILHQTVIVVIGSWLIHWPAPIPVKLGIAMIGCFGITLALHEVIRRTSLLRPLFGMRPRI
jgi:glucans biosynthesis protein C